MPTSAQIFPNQTNQSAASAETSVSKPKRTAARGLEDAFALVLSGMAVTTDSGKAVLQSLNENESKLSQRTQEPERKASALQRDAERTTRGENSLARRGSALDARSATHPDTQRGSDRSANTARSAATSTSQHNTRAPQQASVKEPSSTSSAQPSAAPTPSTFPANQATSGQPAPSAASSLAEQISANTHATAAKQTTSAASQAASHAALQSLDRSLTTGTAARTGSTDAVAGVRGTHSASNAAKSGVAGTKPQMSKHAAGPRSSGAEAALRAQATRGLALALRNGSGTASIRLDPQHMGTLRVDVVVKDGAVTATFKPTTPEAQRLLQHDQRALEHALGSRGLRVDKIEILPAEEGSSSRHAASDGSQTGQAKEGHDARTLEGENGSQHREPHRQRDAGGVAHGSQGEDRSVAIGSTAEHVETTPAWAEPRLGNSLIDTIA